MDEDFVSVENDFKDWFPDFSNLIPTDDFINIDEIETANIIESKNENLSNFEEDIEAIWRRSGSESSSVHSFMDPNVSHTFEELNYGMYNEYPHHPPMPHPYPPPNFHSMPNFNVYANGYDSHQLRQPIPQMGYPYLPPPIDYSLSNMPDDTIVYVPTPIKALYPLLYSTPSIQPTNLFQNTQPASIWNQNHNDPSKSPEYIQEVGQISSKHTNRKSASSSKVSSGKVFECPTCSVKFSRRDELRRHEKIHSGERPLSCPYCDKCFIRSDHRKTHIRTHTGEKPYSCDICQKRFARSDEKLRHRKIHFKSHSRRGRKRLVQPNTDGIKTTEPDTTTKLEETFLSETYTEMNDDMLGESQPMNSEDNLLETNDLNTPDNDLHFTDLLDSLLNN